MVEITFRSDRLCASMYLCEVQTGCSNATELLILLYSHLSTLVKWGVVASPCHISTRISWPQFLDKTASVPLLSDDVGLKHSLFNCCHMQLGTVGNFKVQKGLAPVPKSQTFTRPGVRGVS